MTKRVGMEVSKKERFPDKTLLLKINKNKYSISIKLLLKRLIYLFLYSGLAALKVYTMINSRTGLYSHRYCLVVGVRRSSKRANCPIMFFLMPRKICKGTVIRCRLLVEDTPFNCAFLYFRQKSRTSSQNGSG